MLVGPQACTGETMAGRNLSEGWEAPDSQNLHPFEFHGNTKDYFGIWIVNVLLGLVTLSLYSSWAKVRNKKYFYGHTAVDGHNFDYHATGKQLFLGRLIVIAALSVLVIAQLISPALYLLVLLVLAIILPEIIVRALRFNARVTSHRNVRFNFMGEFGDAFITYLLIPIANVFSLYLCTPFVSRAANRFAINNHSYGDRKFKFDADIGAYYRPFLIALFIGIFLTFVLFGSLMGEFGALIQSGSNADMQEQQMMMFKIILATYAVMFLAIVPVIIYYKAVIRNVTFNNTILDDLHRFESTVNPLRYLWIVLTNVLAAITSIGLLVPWGRVRLAKYMAACTKLIAGGPLDSYSSGVSETSGVIASEYMDMEGFDVGIGF